MMWIGDVARVVPEVPPELPMFGYWPYGWKIGRTGGMGRKKLE